MGLKEVNVSLNIDEVDNVVYPDVEVLYDRIIVQVEKEEKSSGGIIIPGTNEEKPIRGTIVCTGDGKLLEDGNMIPLIVSTGDKVFFSKHAGMEIELEGVKFLVMKQQDVLVIL